MSDFVNVVVFTSLSMNNRSYLVGVCSYLCTDVQMI